MVKRYESLPVTKREKMREGAGTVVLRGLLDGENEMYGKGRLFSELTLAPGCSIGKHEHSGESETYFIVRGTAELDDNGTVVTLGPGDVAYTPDGEYHAIKNVGEDELVFLALILYR